jgi:hypothetical protein
MGAIVLSLLAGGSIVMGLLTRNKAWTVPVLTFGAALVATLTSAAWWVYVGIGLLGLLGVVAVLMRHNRKSVAAPVAAGSLVLTGLAAAGLIAVGTGTPAAAQDTNTPDAATVKALTVTTVPEKALCKTDGNGLVAYDIGSLKPVGKDGRTWSDSVELPFTTTKSADRLAEVFHTNCVNPDYGVMNANFFANMTLGDVKVVDLNPWLKPYQGDGAKVINTKAAEFIPLLNVKNPTDAQVTEAVKKNKEYQELAAKVNTLLSKFSLAGQHSEPSIKNYHLLAGGLSAGTLPAIGLNDKQESLPAEQLVLTNKGRGTCFAKIGYNTGDRRAEQFSCSTYKPPPGSTPTPGPSTTPKPGCKENCGSTTPPDCTHDCGSTPPPGCKHDCTSTPPPGCKHDCGTTPPPKCEPPKPYGEYPDCYGPKPSASQPPGVEKPTDNPVGTPESKPSPKSTPLKPGGGDTTTDKPAPGATQDPGYHPSDPATGAPKPSEAPTTCVPAPGKTSC